MIEKNSKMLFKIRSLSWGVGTDAASPLGIHPDTHVRDGSLPWPSMSSHLALTDRRCGSIEPSSSIRRHARMSAKAARLRCLVADFSVCGPPEFLAKAAENGLIGTMAREYLIASELSFCRCRTVISDPVEISGTVSTLKA